MEESIEGLLSQKQQEWEEDLKRTGMNVEPVEVISREMERYMPSYLFLVLDPEQPHEYGGFKPRGRVAFYTRDDRPFTTDEEGEIHWYQILPDNLPYVKLKVKELVPTVEVRDGMEGYVVPLQESPSFNELKAIVSYQRNLMFWESMLYDEDYGPLTGRFAFLAHAAYRMRGECQKTQTVFDNREEIGRNWYEIYMAVMPDAKKQVKNKKVANPRGRYQVHFGTKAEQVRMDIMREKIKKWLIVSEQDRAEKALLKLHLEELQRICTASEKRNDLLEKVGRDVVGKGLR